MITDDDLFQARDKFEEQKILTYQYVYKQCVSQIKFHSKNARHMTEYRIPSLVPVTGYCCIDIKECAELVTNWLQEANSNIRVQFFEPNKLLINWDRRGNHQG